MIRQSKFRMSEKWRTIAWLALAEFLVFGLGGFNCTDRALVAIDRPDRLADDVRAVRICGRYLSERAEQCR